MDNSNNNQIDALTLKQMLETFEINDKARKRNELKVWAEVATIMIQPQLDEILECQERASTKWGRKLNKVMRATEFKSSNLQ